MLAASSAASLLLCGPAYSQTPPAAAPAPAATPAPPPRHRRTVGARAAPQSSQAPASAGNAIALPDVEVTAPKRVQPVRRPRTQVATERRRQPPVTPPPQSPKKRVADTNDRFDEARRALVAPAGANTYQLNQQALEALPQGTNTPLDKALLQVPGVSQDSAASGQLHVRNEHANLQYRINGIMLPDGVGAFGQIIDTGIVGSLALITGALPAQYGLRTAGVLDIQTKPDAFNNSGSVSVYGGSHGNITTSAEYGGTVGQTQYYVSGRYFGSSVGIENPTPAYNAIHDNTSQEKGFLYLSTVIDPTSRLTFISGVSNGAYQIPNNPGQTPAFTPFGITSFDSSLLNERQQEFNQFNVLAYQKSVDGFDFQLSYFNRYSSLHFMPDPIGDLVFNGVASDVYRQSFINGIQEDTSYRVGFAHTLKFGFSASTENSLVNNGSTALALDPGSGMPTDTPTSVFDSNTKTGYLFSTYLEDEWKVTNQLTVNAGLRFDQMWQFVDANQLSPRINATWKPYDGTTFHAGYSRNFTPPEQVLASPTNLALVQGTTAQPAGLAERSGAAGTLQRLRYRRRSEDLRHPRTRDGARCLLQDRDRSARRRPVRPGLCAVRVQLRPRPECRRRTQGQLHQRQSASLRQCRLGQTARDPDRLEPVSVRSRRTRLHRQRLCLHRPRPVSDRIGRRILSVERHQILGAT